MSDENGALSPLRRTVVGVQFLFVAFGSMVIVPLLVGLEPTTILVSAGIGTLLFHAITKGKVPIFLGCSFAFITPIQVASKQWGMSGTLAGMLGVSLVYFVMSILIKWRGQRFIHRLFPPVVIGPVIMLIGLSLSKSAIDMACTDWFLAVTAFVVAVVVLFFGKGLLKLVPVACGIVVGSVVAALCGKMDFTAVAQSPWFSVPSGIAHFHMPQFAWEPLLFMMPVAVAPVIEHIGDVYVVGAVADKDFVSDGLACLLGCFLGSTPVTTYSEVTGAMQITHVTSPKVIRIAAIAAIVLSFFGKLSALLQSVPRAVLGGIMLMLFGTIASVGIQTLVREKVDFSITRNILIVGVTLTIGIGGAVLQFGTFSLSGIGLASIVGVVLNLLLPEA